MNIAYSVSRHEIIEWINNLLSIELTKIEQLYKDSEARITSSRFANKRQGEGYDSRTSKLYNCSPSTVNFINY